MNPLGPRAGKTLELYDFEACPFCRKVRETLCALDLEVFSTDARRRSSRLCARGAVRQRRLRPSAPASGGA